jgi:hypothetical protein
MSTDAEQPDLLAWLDETVDAAADRLPSVADVFPSLQWENETLIEARRRCEYELEDGTSCPLCGQTLKLYKRILECIMVRGLMWLVQQAGEQRAWVHVHDKSVGPSWLRAKGGSFAKLAHWGFIEQAENEDGSKKTSGVWRPTQKGVDFVSCRIQVPSHVHLLLNTVVGWSERQVYVYEMLSARFDYQKLMRGEEW